MGQITRSFHKLARKSSRAVGSSYAFILALMILFLWAMSGPFLGFSDTWQLVINTGTTIVTFLTVFLIQNSQNRDSEAVQIKLDELIRSIKGARNTMIDIEELSDEELNKLEKEFRKLKNKIEER
jgi:low affinity Fe/Cu permease